MPKIAFMAGEASGDQLGGWLMSAMRDRRPDLRFIGIGGERMQAQGLQSLFSIRDINLMGFAEVLPHVRKLKRRIREMVAYIEREKPEIVLSIDSPGFVLRVVKQLRERGRVHAKFIHYVAPTVWAYKPERAKKFAQYFDHLLCLLPFEPPYFEAENLPVTFVGHEVAWWWKIKGDGSAFRQKHHIPSDDPLLAVFPGSRQGEISRMWPEFRGAIEQLHATMPHLRVVIQVTPNLVERMQAETRGMKSAPLILNNTEDKRDLFAASTAAIAKSGTIGLECALAGLPSIIAYKANPVSIWLIRRMTTLKYANLANILANRLIIPELIQEDCRADSIARAVLPLLNDAKARAAQRHDLAHIADQLGVNDAHSPSEKAAEVVLNYF